MVIILLLLVKQQNHLLRRLGLAKQEQVPGCIREGSLCQQENGRNRPPLQARCGLHREEPANVPKRLFIGQNALNSLILQWHRFLPLLPPLGKKTGICLGILCSQGMWHQNSQGPEGKAGCFAIFA